MEIIQKYNEVDQAGIDKMHKIIEHHSELLIREILESSPSGHWDYECERKYRNDPVRDLLIKQLCDLHSRMLPELKFIF